MTSPPPNLRVATYNVHGCVGTDGRYDPDRVASVVAELDADIVALQEFTYPASVAIESRMPVTLTMLDRYECVLGPTRRTVTECFGNALFTRHRVVDVQRVDLSMESRESRGALAASLEIRGTSSMYSQPISVYGSMNGVFRCVRFWSISNRSATRWWLCSVISTTGCPADRLCTSSTIASDARLVRRRFRCAGRSWRSIASG